MKVLKRMMSAILALLICIGAIFPLDIMKLKGAEIYAVAEDDSGNIVNNVTEIGATNSIGQLLTEALKDENSDFEPNGFYNIIDLEFDLKSGEIAVQLSSVDFCNLVVCFYNDGGNELITSVTQRIAPEAEMTKLQVDISKLEDTFVIKAFLLDDQQLPLTQAYVCNTYTSAMQEILSTTVDDFNEEYVINMDDDKTTNFLVLAEETKMLPFSDTENVLADSDYENGIYQFSNPDETLLGLQEGDIFCYQNQTETIVDKVGIVEKKGDQVTIICEDTDLQEAFEFVKIEADSNDFDIMEMEDTAEYAELVDYGKVSGDQGDELVYKQQPRLARAKMHEESLWDHFSFTYEIYNNELYSKKSDDTADSNWNEKLEISGEVTFMIDPHINCYWSLRKKYFEIHFEVVTETDFTLEMNGSYEGTVAKFDEISFGKSGIYFKLAPELQVEVEATLDITVHSEETFGFHYDTSTGGSNLHKEPVVTSKDPSFEGKIGIYLNLNPKLVIVTEKAANITFVTKIGVVISAKTYLPNLGIEKPDKADIHECSSCISGKISLIVKLGWEGKAFNGAIKIGDITNLTLNKEIPLLDYYISSFGDAGFTKCPHHQYRVRFRLLDEKLLPLKNATISLTKEPPNFMKKLGVPDSVLKSLALDETLVTNEDGIAEIWFPQSKESNVPIQVVISHEIYPNKELEFQFKGKPKKLTIHVYPEGYVGKIVKDILETLTELKEDLGIEDPTDDKVEPTEDTTIQNPNEDNNPDTPSATIIASGECGADGDNLTWTLDSEGTLTISGEGEMMDLDNSSNVPWYSYRSDILNVKIKNGVTSIGTSAFEYCTKLITVTIPDSITNIGCHAFENTSWLDEKRKENPLVIINSILIDGISCEGDVVIPTNVTNIAAYTFCGCEKITSVTIPDSVTTIERNAFDQCDNLTSIIIPDSVKSIETSTFHFCTSLTTITLPGSVTSIGDYAFMGCDILTDVYYLGTEDEWNNITIGSENERLYDSDVTIHYNSAETDIIDSGTCGANGDNLTWTLDSEGTLTISGEGEMVRSRWESYRENIRKVTIQDGVTSIGDWAFNDYNALTTITIPDSVTSIEDYAFEGCTALTTITIPDSVTSIGDRAFDGCDALTTITLPDSVTSIGKGAFGKTPWLEARQEENPLVVVNGILIDGEKCEGTVAIPDSVTSIGECAFYEHSWLTSITIPNSVTSIGECAFYECSRLTSITIPDSVTSIGGSAFSFTPWLEARQEENPLVVVNGILIDGEKCEGTVAIPDSVTSIGEEAFYGCAALTSITIPNSVTSIGEYAFYRCDALTTITIPDSVTSIGEGAFYECSRLTSITIPDSVTSIGDGAFYRCDALTTITIPDSVTSIGGGAFYECDALTTVTIPDGVTSIGTHAFNDCDALTTVIIPDSVTSIGKGAFSNCSNLTAITVSGNNASYTDIDGVLFTKDTAIIMAYPPGKTENTYVIPDSVTSIGDYAFEGCFALTNITIPDSVTSIGESAFEFCNLTTITIPDSVTNIGVLAFYHCVTLTAITIPDGVTRIGDSTFEGCDSLTSITIPDSVTNIGVLAFYDCDNLTDVYYSGTKEEWNAINIEDSNEDLRSATIYYNSNMPSTKSLLRVSYSNFSSASNTKSYTYPNAVPKTDYLLLAVNSAEAEDILSSKNLLYIDQQTADETGNVNFSFVVPDDCKYIFIGDFGKGNYCRVVSDIISTNIDDCTICPTPDDNGEDLPVVPTTTTTASLNTTTSTTTTTTTTKPTTTTSTTTTSTPPTTEPAYLLGDVNEDGAVDSSDASLVLAEYAKVQTGGAGDFTKTQHEAADVNNDDVVDSSDASKILAYYAMTSTGQKPTWD